MSLFLVEHRVQPQYQIHQYQMICHRSTAYQYTHPYAILLKLWLILSKIYLDFFVDRTEFSNKIFELTLSWRRPISYRNQSIDLRSKSMDWFLYDIGLRHERVNISFQYPLLMLQKTSENQKIRLFQRN